MQSAARRLGGSIEIRESELGGVLVALHLAQR
jgi:hypothetical protein